MFDYFLKEDQVGINEVYKYMYFDVGQLLQGVNIDVVFIGFCINGCIEDLCVVVEVVKGKKIVVNCVMIVLGFGLVWVQVEEEGFVEIFQEVGFEWCMVGCLMCLVMNFD